jgi:TonB family protein
MNRITHVAEEFSGWKEALCWVVGAGFTSVLFLGLAYSETSRPSQPVTEMSDLRAVALPLEPPPPPPRTEEIPPQPQEDALALTDIEIGASDSPVHIAVVPPDLAALVPAARELPGAIMKSGYLSTDLKPRVNVEADVHHIYQVTEVDRPPHAIVRVAPPASGRFFAETRTLRVDLMLVIDVNGRAVSARIVQSSGKPDFDNIVAQTVRDQWEFSPAIRRGKKVKCLAMQPIRVTLDRGTPFEAR